MSTAFTSKHHFSTQLRTWLTVLVSLCLAFLFILPTLYVLAHLFFTDAGDVWQHLYQTNLGIYIKNSLILAIGVGGLSAIIGTSTAWLISRYDFPGRNTMQWMLLLPMALPAYILAFTYTGILDVAGPVQIALRNLFGWQVGDYWFPETRSLTGACIVLSLVLYPYIYLLARASFFEQSHSTLHVSRSLGLNAFQSFYKVALPMARPALIGGISLVVMETLADYGAVQYFGIQTLTTGIFRTWFGMDAPSAAAQLSGCLLVIILIVLFIERVSRRRARYHQNNQQQSVIALSKNKAWLASIFCCLPILLGFLLPVIQLIVWALSRLDTIDQDFIKLCLHSIGLASATALLAIFIVLFLLSSQRFFQNKLQGYAIQLMNLGYAIPGVIIAVGAVVIAGYIDNALNQLILNGSLALLIYAYLVRFLAAASKTIDAGFEKIPPSIDESARSLGKTPRQVFTQIHFPLLRNGLFTAAIIVFVDTLKELPATLIMRPFNFNTLAVRAYELASDERLADAALPSLAIVLVGLIPVIILSNSSLRARNKPSKPLAQAPNNITKHQIPI